MTTDSQEPPLLRADFAYWARIETRWSDNDIYGHVNNVAYYSYFDTVVNGFAISRGGLDIHGGTAIGIVVESGCRYHASFSFPQSIDAGLRVDRIGRSSIRYAVGLFELKANAAAADGHFVHVMVDRNSRRPVDIPAPLRRALEQISGVN
ncbi:MAG TPA: thioesterase [Afipia sp.]|nr:hypothetical protein [Afipia sp.]OUX62618.1 MAG: hypothetical protein CBB64_03435 [Afipia sp. TMED4]HAO40031.1 thioesterase [Afipia sp.]HAP11879.1 thioesterase [Afipia sp.]HAQ95554.1 thioesterase [Afipia sp.]